MISAYRSFVLMVLLLMVVALSPATAALPAFWDDEPMPSLAPMLEKAMPSVVNVSTEGKVVESSPLLDDPFFKKFFNFPDIEREQKTMGLGSGVIFNADKGYIVTNHHVIKDAEVINVALHDGRRLQAKVLGADPDTDIAVIQIDAENLSQVKFADSEKLRVGDFVVAIGSPFGLRQTVTSGIVSALGRSGLGIESYEDFIQTDASINPGNSGGALVNLRGELVGINTAILGPNGGNIGIGFAIPSSMAKDVVTQLITEGKVKRGRLGVTAQDLTPELAGAFGIQQNQGAVIAQVEEGMAAARAGLRAGDVVTRVNGRKISNSSGMRNAVGMLRVGSRVEMDVLRNGKTQRIVAIVEELELKSVSGQSLHPKLAGLEFSDHEQGGVVISKVDPRSIAGRQGLREGDRLLSLNKKEVTRVKELPGAARLNERGVLLNIQRGSSAYFLLLK